MLQEGDIFELKEGDTVYSTVPEHFLYSNRRGSFAPAHGQVTIGGELSYLAGEYVVCKTALEGGGTGHGMHDVYPDGHHVYAERIGEDGPKVDFYQSGCFSAMLPHLKATGRAIRTWKKG